jgi:hypothetical protein
MQNIENAYIFASTGAAGAAPGRRSGPVRQFLQGRSVGLARSGRMTEPVADRHKLPVAAKLARSPGKTCRDRGARGATHFSNSLTFNA